MQILKRDYHHHTEPSVFEARQFSLRRGMITIIS